MTTQALGRLTAGEVAFFRQEGYLTYREPVLPPAEFEALRAFFEGLLADLPAGDRPEAMDKPHFMHPELFRWVFSDEILGLAESILGPDLALFSTHFICKPKGDGKRVPWHEDSAYWKGLLDPMEALTVWLAIDPSTQENGCMHVIPRTHANGFSRYENVDLRANVFGTEIVQDDRKGRASVAIELQPNQCSLHDARMMHGSPPNTSALRRCGFTMRFVKSSTRLSPTVEDRLRLYHARGKDYGINRYADPAKTYPELLEANARMYRIH
ncbi:MAG: phytanoyl-CoA dioxygenase family protein [Planctomycetota bacterium]|nr:phytanoyl-CoA dioxygenase family protein [Planctomycetota bacterium]